MKKNNVLKITLVAVAVIAFFSFLFAFGSFGVDAVLACIPLEEGGQAPPADCTCGDGENAGTPSCDAFGEAYCDFGSGQGECGDNPPEGTVGGKSGGGGVTSSLQGDADSTGTTALGSLSVTSFTALLNGEKFTCNKDSLDSSDLEEAILSGKLSDVNVFPTDDITESLKKCFGSRTYEISKGVWVKVDTDCYNCVKSNDPDKSAWDGNECSGVLTKA